MINIHLKFFGAFREYGDNIDFCVPLGSNIKTVKQILTEKMPNIDIELVKSSAIANDNAVFTAMDTLNQDCTLSILPPVCGG